MAEMVQGQLYRVGITCRNPGEVSQIELITIGSDIANVRERFPYVFDLSEFASYRIDYIAKEPARSLVIKTKTKREAIQDPDAVISHGEGSVGVWQNVASSSGMRFEVTALATLYAKDAHHAIKKMGERVLSGSDAVLTTATQLAAPSGFAVAKDQSMFERATFVRG